MTNVNGKSDMIPTESETTRTVGNFSHGSRETPATSSSPMELDRSEKARCQHPDMHVAGESDSSIVPEKPANKGGVLLPAELAEGRELTKENTEQSLLDRTQSRNSDGQPFVPRSRGLLGIREAARKEWSDYAEDFEQRINDLHGRIHRGAYRAKPSKRTYILKPDGPVKKFVLG